MSDESNAKAHSAIRMIVTNVPWAFIEDEAVTWPSGLDLAPDAMYDVIRSGAVFTG